MTLINHVYQDGQKPKLLDQVRYAIRTKHYSIRTEEAYVQWIRRFILFHNKRHPPDNSGKSTIVGAFRILAEGIRKASSRNPERIDLPDGRAWGYHVPLDDLPVATENIFSDYDDSQPALVDFRLLGGNRLELVFPESNGCYLVCTTTGRPVRSTSDFRREFQASVGFVPVLGPVEHNVPLYQILAAFARKLSKQAVANRVTLRSFQWRGLIHRR